MTVSICMTGTSALGRSFRSGQTRPIYAESRRQERVAGQESTMVTQAIGWTLLLLVALWVATELVTGWQRLWVGRRVNQRRIAKLSCEIEQLRKGGTVAKHRPEADVPAWQGSRSFRVLRKICEIPGCHSFYLVPLDGKPLEPFVPGQFLTFSLEIPGEAKPVVRCYSLSTSPRPDFYRCTIKRVLAPTDDPSVPPGKASQYFNELVGEGDVLDVKAPRGSFRLDSASRRPVILIAAGVGITPLHCMASWLSATQADRPAHLFYGVTNSHSHIFRQELIKLAASYRNLRMTTFYSRPLRTDQPGRDFDFAGRMQLAHIRKLIDTKDAEYYLCGPGDFMRQLQRELSAWGIPDADLHFEAFGPSSVRRDSGPSPARTTNGQAMVRFERSDKTVRWQADCSSLLDLAERHGIQIEAGCRSGNCGTCVTALKSGRLDYLEEPTADCEDGSCFPCICVPAENVVLDV
jgi:ferredoxin-NADP reductase